MAELLQSGAVFIHVPKNGGTWVSKALKATGLWRCRIGYKHSTPEMVNDIWCFHRSRYIKHWFIRPDVTPGRLRHAFKFGFVRNPLSWYESWWKFMMGKWHPWETGRWHPQRPIDECGDDDFNIFLSNVLRVRPGYVTEMYGWYTQGLAFVGKNENLTKDLITVLHTLNEVFDEQIVRTLHRVNVSVPNRDAPRWDPGLLRKIIASESVGIERYGYGDDVHRFCETFRS